MGYIKSEIKELDHLTPRPLKRKDDDIELFFYLGYKQKFKPFCIHDWLIWTYGDLEVHHRVCKKCYKKQKRKGGKWVKDKPVE